MIREPKNENCVKINVYLKSGETFIDKDIPANLMGNNDQIISFWYGNILRLYPLSEVKYFEYTFSNEK